MTVEQHRKRWLVTGCGLITSASLGLMGCALAYHWALIGDAVMFSLVLMVAGMMAVGTTVAAFSLKRS